MWQVPDSAGAQGMLQLRPRARLALTPAPGMLPVREELGSNGGVSLGRSPSSTAQHPHTRARKSRSSPQLGGRKIILGCTGKSHPHGPFCSKHPQGQTLNSQTPRSTDQEHPTSRRAHPWVITAPGATAEMPGPSRSPCAIPHPGRRASRGTAPSIPQPAASPCRAARKPEATFKVLWGGLAGLGRQ